MHKLAVGIITTAAMAWMSHANAAEKLRFAYLVQVHQAHMMVLDEYARRHGIELEVVPMRRYADTQLALMTNQLDAAVMGYINVGLMEEKSFRDYRVIAGSFTGGFGITLANGVEAGKWSDLEGLKLGSAPNSLAELVFKSTASLGGADLAKIQLVSFTAGGPPMLAALKSREIDGFILWEPNNAEAALGKYGYYSSLDITAPTRASTASLPLIRPTCNRNGRPWSASRVQSSTRPTLSTRISSAMWMSPLAAPAPRATLSANQFLTARSITGSMQKRPRTF